MAINIKNTEVDYLIKELRQLTGLGPTELVKLALTREYHHQRQQQRQQNLSEHLASLQETALKKVNNLDPNALYDEQGLPS